MYKHTHTHTPSLYSIITTRVCVFYEKYFGLKNYFLLHFLIFFNNTSLVFMLSFSLGKYLLSNKNISNRLYSSSLCSLKGSLYISYNSISVFNQNFFVCLRPLHELERYFFHKIINNNNIGSWTSDKKHI